ncbi:MAG: ribosomal protein S18-alanine N-acetyltransferase [Acidobacteriota bacterium]|nr:ribosomal protein S18-alanine N-acetyltransferase [Acidobacteriota bacterium]
MKDLKFRQMTVEDVPAVLEIERECLLSPWSAEGYRAELSRNDSGMFIVENIDEDKTEIIGFVAARLITSANEGEILNIAVRRAFRKRGIGALLLLEIKDFLKSNAVRSVFLEVRKSNLAAREFYRRNGFEFCGERKNFYTNPAEDALVLKLNL